LSFSLAVILLALLPAKKLFTVESGCLGDQIQTVRDGADSFALVRYAASPQASGEVLYLIIEGAVCAGESPVVSSHSYRGPPVPF
jgi:hypothetical protein